MSSQSMKLLVAALMLAPVIAAPVATASPPAAKGKPAPPSRAAEKGCRWERFDGASIGLDAWVQRCDYGDRKIDFVAAKHSLAQRWSDGGAEPDPLVDVIDLKAGEAPEAGIRRLFAKRTDKSLVAHCVLAPFHGAGMKTPAGVKRYTFVADKVLAKQLKAKEVPGDIPDPACGDWGDMPDGIQYWEAQPASGIAKVLFVRIGQDTPLFDEATLKLR